MAYVRKVETASGAGTGAVARKHRGQRVSPCRLDSRRCPVRVSAGAFRRIVAEDQKGLDFEVSARTQRVQGGLVRWARAEGVALAGPEGSLKALTKTPGFRFWQSDGA